eukprot:TRINITY_DN1978_c0_g1_i1.p2 TRINITY_DN1978_c0_g1~~TRINITY_DN1978_c0_g1_i1.p2  ORF type:complete len:335 (+),score=183.11 TRINITY_DN1978_c0_g1_i1:30-1034(+)
MAFFFNQKKKDPITLVRSLKDALTSAEKNGRTDKIVEEVNKQLSSIKLILIGDPENEPNHDLGNQIATEICSNDVIPLFATQLSKLDFESKKDISIVFNNVMRRTISNRQPIVDYICKNPSILSTFISGFENQEISSHCGAILKQCSQNEALAKLILNSPNFYSFFELIQSPSFDIASESFNCFKEVILKHKDVSAEFLEKNYDQVFSNYTKLLHSDNYVVRRQSLKLLGELLLDRANFNIMTKYISDVENLKLMMNLLRDKSKSIQFESFHVFKVFVANPNKPVAVSNMLIKNKKPLIPFLKNFQSDNEEDQFNEEKAFLVKQIESLPEKKIE